MPQTLTREWKEELGENWEEIHETYLNTIGNLTLTGYNSKYQNKPFLDKRDMENGFSTSRLFLNRYLQSLKKWDKSEIILRANLLKEKALKIWKFPKTNYLPKKDEEKIFHISDENENFIGKKVISFTFEEQEYSISNWRDFYHKVGEILYELDPTKFITLVSKKFEKDYLNKRFSNNESELRTPLKIAEGVFLESHFNANTIFYMIGILLKEFEIELDNLSFYIK
jgi:hypothetical protein